MVFGNNPGCHCCKHLHVWDDNYLTPTKIFRTNAVGGGSGIPGEEITTFGSFEWDGTILSATNTASRSYDVIYAKLSGERLRQYDVTNTTETWEKTLVSQAFEGYTPLSSGSPYYNLSVGDHGLLMESGYWVEKDGTEKRPFQIPTFNIDIVGVGVYPVVGTGPGQGQAGYLNFSPNSPHASVAVRGGNNDITNYVGDFDLVDNAGFYDYQLTPSHTFSNPNSSTTYVSYSLGAGSGGTLFWVGYDGTDAVDVNLPGKTWQGTGGEIGTAALLCSPPDSISYRHQVPDTELNVTFGTHAVDGTTATRVAGVDASHTSPGNLPGAIFSSVSGRLSIYEMPRWQTQQAAELGVQEYFPQADGIEAYVKDLTLAGYPGEWGLDLSTFDLYVDYNLDQMYQVESMNFAARKNWVTSVILRDGIGGGLLLYNQITRAGGAADPLIGTVADFEILFKTTSSSYPVINLSTTDGSTIDAGHFVVYTTGTVTYGDLTITGVDADEYTAQISGISGGEDGGTITVTNKTPTRIEMEGFGLRGAPFVLESFTVSAEPEP